MPTLGGQSLSYAAQLELRSQNGDATADALPRQYLNVTDGVNDENENVVSSGASELILVFPSDVWSSGATGFGQWKDAQNHCNTQLHSRRLLELFLLVILESSTRAEIGQH